MFKRIEILEHLLRGKQKDVMHRSTVKEIVKESECTELTVRAALKAFKKVELVDMKKKKIQGRTKNFYGISDKAWKLAEDNPVHFLLSALATLQDKHVSPFKLEP